MECTRRFRAVVRDGQTASAKGFTGHVSSVLTFSHHGGAMLRHWGGESRTEPFGGKMFQTGAVMTSPVHDDGIGIRHAGA